EIMLVTKSDTGAAAERARVDAAAAVQQSRHAEAGAWRVPVLTVSAIAGDGIAALIDALDAHRAWLAAGGRLAARRAAQEEGWIADALRERYGSEGLRRAGDDWRGADGSPFRRLAALERRLARLI